MKENSECEVSLNGVFNDVGVTTNIRLRFNWDNSVVYGDDRYYLTKKEKKKEKKTRQGTMEHVNKKFVHRAVLRDMRIVTETAEMYGWNGICQYATSGNCEVDL